METRAEFILAALKPHKLAHTLLTIFIPAPKKTKDSENNKNSGEGSRRLRVLINWELT